MGTNNGGYAEEVLLPRAELLQNSPFEATRQRGFELETLAETIQERDEEPATPHVTVNGRAYSVVGELASDIEEVPIDWLWTGRIATGFINMLYGESGAGKSTFWADIVARVTTGRPLPDGEQSVPGGVVVVSVEEPSKEILVPRLRKMGADMSRICVLSEVSRNAEGLGGTIMGKFQLPMDLPMLEAAIKRVNATLVILDPIAGIAGTSIYRNQGMRQSIMEPLQSMAYRMGVAVLFVGHFVKGSAKDTNLLMRCGGTEGIVAYARSVLALVNDAGNNNQRVLMTIKRSLSKPVPQVVARLNEADMLEYVHGQLPSVAELQRAKKYSLARQNIQAMIDSEPDRLFNAAEITHALDLENPNVRKHLSNLFNEGLIASPARGLYQAIRVYDAQQSQGGQETQASQDSQVEVEAKQTAEEAKIVASNLPTEVLAPTNGHRTQVSPNALTEVLV